MPHRFFRLIAPLAVVVALPAAAKDKEKPAVPAPIQELYACRDMADASARLACFDREVGELAAADQAREITFTDRATAREARRGLFGFSFPRLGGIFGGDEDEVQEIETTVRSATIDRSGKYTILMEDGAVWQQIDNTRLNRDPQAGQKVRIKVASMGSYFATIGNGRSIRVKRNQ